MVTEPLPAVLAEVGVQRPPGFLPQIKQSAASTLASIQSRYRFFFAAFFFARFLAIAPFLPGFTFDFFTDFLREAEFALLLPSDVDVKAIDDLVDFFRERPSDVVALATDFSAFIGVPLRISSPIVSAVLATGLFPRADCSPTMAPATPPAIAPTGPPTIPPRTAPVTPPTACLEKEMFFSADTLTDGRVAFFLDFLAIVLSVSCAGLDQRLGKCASASME